MFRLLVPPSIWSNLEQSKGTLFDLDNSADMARAFVDDFSMNGHERKGLICCLQKSRQAAEVHWWLPRDLLSALFKRRLSKLGIRGWDLQSAYIGQAKALKSIKVHVITNDRDHKELWADLDDISLDRARFQASSESNQRPIARGFQQQ